MNYMMAILPKMGGFLLLVLIGFTASRTGIIKKEAMPSISGFLLRIVLPALTIGLILENQTTFQTMTQYGKMVLSQILMYFLWLQEESLEATFVILKELQPMFIVDVL